MARCRILHLSDTHLHAGFKASKATGGYNPNRTYLLAEWVWENGWKSATGPAFDHIFVSGDLAHCGTAEDLGAAHELLYGAVGPGEKFLTASRSPTLQGAAKEGESMPASAMPGNHDRFQDTAGTPGGLLFDKIFNPPWQPGFRRAHPFVVPTDDPALDVALIAGDCCLEHPNETRPPGSRVALLGQGYVDPRSVADEMKVLTQSLRRHSPAGKTRVAIWATHFPPFHGPPVQQNLMLVNEDEIAARASGEKVRLILSGHLHVTCDPIRQPAHTFEIWCAGSPCATDNVLDWLRAVSGKTPPTRHFFHILELVLHRVDGGTEVAVTRRNFEIVDDPEPAVVEREKWVLPGSGGPGLPFGLRWTE